MRWISCDEKGWKVPGEGASWWNSYCCVGEKSSNVTSCEVGKEEGLFNVVYIFFKLLFFSLGRADVMPTSRYRQGPRCRMGVGPSTSHHQL